MTLEEVENYGKGFNKKLRLDYLSTMMMLYITLGPNLTKSIFVAVFSISFIVDV